MRKINAAPQPVAKFVLGARSADTCQHGAWLSVKEIHGHNWQQKHQLIYGRQRPYKHCWGFMFTRALLAFLAFLVLPGVVAIAVPVTWLWVSSHTNLVHPFGLVPLGVGLFAVLWCVRDFCVWGNGTVAPWAPPARLVVVGLYRYTRNPIYIAVILMVLGWAVSFAFRGLFVYAIVVAVAFHLRVVLAEEPWLARTHGARWVQYASRVPRWLW